VAVDEATGALSVYVSPVMVGVHRDVGDLAVDWQCRQGNIVWGTVRHTTWWSLPTANLVVADIYRVVAANKNPGLHTLMPTSSDNETVQYRERWILIRWAKFYIWIPYQDGLGIIRSVGALWKTRGFD
jgi:hypothetical protein